MKTRGQGRLLHVRFCRESINWEFADKHANTQTRMSAHLRCLSRLRRDRLGGHIHRRSARGGARSCGRAREKTTRLSSSAGTGGNGRVAQHACVVSRAFSTGQRERCLTCRAGPGAERGRAAKARRRGAERARATRGRSATLEGARKKHGGGGRYRVSESGGALRSYLHATANSYTAPKCVALRGLTQPLTETSGSDEQGSALGILSSRRHGRLPVSPASPMGCG